MMRNERNDEAKAAAEEYMKGLASEEYLGGLLEVEYFTQHFLTEIVVIHNLDGGGGVKAHRVGKISKRRRVGVGDRSLTVSGEHLELPQRVILFITPDQKGYQVFKKHGKTIFPTMDAAKALEALALAESKVGLWVHGWCPRVSPARLQPIPQCTSPFSPYYWQNVKMPRKEFFQYTSVAVLVLSMMTMSVLHLTDMTL